MKLDFYTITIKGKCFDLPKDMPIPRRGDKVFIDTEIGIVDVVNYHLNTEKKLNMISIKTK